MHGNPGGIRNGKKRAFFFKRCTFHPQFFFFSFTLLSILLLPLLSPSKESKHVPFPAYSVPVFPVLMAFPDGRCCARQEPNEKK